jgi:RNA polymerase sigma-70 factor (ECF subfamily)
MYFDETIFEPKPAIGATQMNSPIYSGSDVSLERSSKAMNDELLVLAAKSGDTAAFVELRRRHATKLLRTIYRVTRSLTA